MNRIISALLMLFTLPSNLHAEKIGSVDTVFKFLGSNHKIVVEAFDDPRVPGVTCHLSRAKTGGISGSLGIAEDKAEASIACRQIGPIKLPSSLQNGKQVLNKKTSLVFKTLQVVRFYDKKRDVLIYLVYSNKLIDGSPKNSISTVSIRKWQNPLSKSASKYNFLVKII